MLRYLFSMIVMFSFGLVAYGQGWRGVVPLHSDCGDVERVFGVKGCGNGTYDFDDSKVSILFSKGTCVEGWRARPGVVLTIYVHPKTRQRFSDLRLDENRYRKVSDPVVPGIVYFNNELEGLSIAVGADGFLLYYFYGPAHSDRGLKCESDKVQALSGGELTLTKFDEYGVLADFESEKIRLDRFAFQLLAVPSLRGYIIASGTSPLQREEAKDRAGRAKGYLMKKGISADRLLVNFDGCKANPTIELFLSAELATEIPSSLVTSCR